MDESTPVATGVEHNYSFTDNNPLRGNNYYRLKQVDLDGKFTYSKMIRLAGNTTANDLTKVYPNPAAPAHKIAGRRS